MREKLQVASVLFLEILTSEDRLLWTIIGVSLIGGLGYASDVPWYNYHWYCLQTYFGYTYYQDILADLFIQGTRC